jgi:hypothetical protein
LYDVLVPRKVLKRIERMPESIQDRMADLLYDLGTSALFNPACPTKERLARLLQFHFSRPDTRLEKQQFTALFLLKWQVS